MSLKRNDGVRNEKETECSDYYEGKIMDKRISNNTNLLGTQLTNIRITFNTMK
jgi:hypothetical protein